MNEINKKQQDLEKEIKEFKQGCDKEIIGDNNCGEDFPDELGEPFAIYCDDCLLKTKELSAELSGIKFAKEEILKEIKKIGLPHNGFERIKASLEKLK